MKNLRNILLIVLLVLFDQLTKLYFYGKNIYIFKYLSLSFISNTGASFGILKGNNLLFIFITLIVIGLMIYYFNKEKKYLMAFTFLLAGAFGNLIDRIFRGFVVDFIDFKFWYVFNLADTFVTIGILLLVYYLFKEKY